MALLDAEPTEEQVEELHAKIYASYAPASNTADRQAVHRKVSLCRLADDLGVKYLPATLASMLDDEGKLPQFSSLGGYTILYLDAKDVVLCADCASDPENEATASGSFDEGPPEYCEECNAEIESSYGDPDKDEPESEV